MRKHLWAVALSLLTTAAPVLAAPPSSERPAPPPARAATASSAEPRAGAGVVNLNDAAPEQLALLPGVGPSRAAAIVSFRKQHPFKRLEDLQRIKGIGKKTFVRLRPLLVLTGPTTLTVRPGRN